MDRVDEIGAKLVEDIQDVVKNAKKTGWYDEQKAEMAFYNFKLSLRAILKGKTIYFCYKNDVFFFDEENCWETCKIKEERCGQKYLVLSKDYIDHLFGVKK